MCRWRTFLDAVHDEAEAMIANFLLFGAFGIIGYFFILEPKRSSQSVLQDLKSQQQSSALNEQKRDIENLDSELTQVGILDREKQKSLKLKINLLPCIIPSLLLIVRFLLGYDSIEGAIMAALFGFSAGVFLARRIKSSLRKKFIDRIEFYLPLAMERIVMAVESGLDLIPALKTLTQLEEKVGDPNDPTTGLFKQVIELTEHGVRFERSLEEVGKHIEGSSLRHAFVHLSLAHKEGGEVVAPLRELSDATQMQFQENIEEHIAKIPVKATVPLLVMFIGLLICFLTPPAIQVLSVTSEMGTGIKSSQGISKNLLHESRGNR